MLGNHWHDNGRYFIDQPVEWELEGSNPSNIKFKNESIARVGLPENSRTDNHVAGRLTAIHGLLSQYQFPFNGKPFRRISAERDIRAESATPALELAANGQGATNIIRRFITTANPELPRDIIQKDVLNALNTIFGKDGRFTEIIVRQHDENTPAGFPSEAWEIYLGQDKKGPIPRRAAKASATGAGLRIEGWN
jgi:putative ATP-dependent endonuclease of the OLD family